MGPRLCTPLEVTVLSHFDYVKECVWKSPSTIATSAPWRLSCTCRGRGTSGSGRPEASGAQTTMSTVYESECATWACCFVPVCRCLT